MTLALRLSDRPLWATPLNYIIDLRDLMDEYYGRGLWTNRTGVNVGSDIVPAVHAGCDRLRAAYGYGTITIPPGLWMVKTAFNATKLSGISLIGETSATSILVVSASNGLHRNGSGGFAAYKQMHLGMLKEDGFTGGVGCLDQGDSVSQPGQITVRDIYMSALGTGRWGINLLMDGSLKTTGAAGVRVADMADLQLFQSGAANAYAIGLFNLKQAEIGNIGTYGGTGTLAGNMYMGNAGVVGANCQQVSVRRMVIGGLLECTNSTEVELRGVTGTVAYDTTFDYVEGWLDAGGASGTIGANSDLIIR
jgi:hypothetical protein